MTLEYSGADDAKRVLQRRGETFTGEVWGEARITSPEGLRVNTIEFLPSCRTYWHRHEGGQVLIITAGRGYIGTRDGNVIEVSAGDVIWTPPGVDHYHGARDDSFLLHDAISFGNTEWLEPVKDEDYGKVQA
jgi:quercetin dioxygenase-like cupin family protein